MLDSRRILVGTPGSKGAESKTYLKSKFCAAFQKGGARMLVFVNDWHARGGVNVALLARRTWGVDLERECVAVRRGLRLSAQCRVEDHDNVPVGRSIDNTSLIIGRTVASTKARNRLVSIAIASLHHYALLRPYYVLPEKYYFYIICKRNDACISRLRCVVNGSPHNTGSLRVHLSRCGL